MSRRLATTKACAVCAEPFHPLHQEQPTCSRTCGGIRNARLKPRHYQMVAANHANRARLEAGLAEKLAGVSVVEAYKLGVKRGYATAHQKFSRQQRRAA